MSSHQEKQRIFDAFIKSQDIESVRLGNEPIEAENWEDVLLAFRYSSISLQTMKELIFAACDLVQEEQQKNIAENANLHWPYDGKTEWIDKDSIINPENKIL